MKTALRALRLIALSLWVGSIVFFVVVAGLAFKALPDAHAAGLIVRGSLLSLDRIGLLAGSIYLFCTLALLVQHDLPRVRAGEATVVLLMLALTLFLQQSVMPRMETDRLTLGGDVQKSSPDLPARRHFDQLHILSTRLVGTVLVGGLLLLCLAPLEAGRERSLAG